MQVSRTAIILLALMCLSSMAGVLARPSTVAPVGPHFDVNVPKEFADWRELPQTGASVSDPATDELLKKLYGEILTRTYVNKDGYRIMLSLAWGPNQNGNLQAHRPEVCYPAQGFALLAKNDGTVATAFGNIDVTRLSTALGARNEPVTYWLTNGNQVVRTRLDKRIVQIKLFLSGTVPDGILFRVSSIDTNTDKAFAMQQAFVADLMAAVPAQYRQRLGGLGSVSPPA